MPVGGVMSLLALGGVVGGLSLLLSILLTNPVTIGPAGVTIWFVVLGLTLASLLALGLYGLKGLVLPHLSARRRLSNSWRQSLLLSGWLTVLLALSSLDQFSWRDSFLLLGLMGLVEVYLRARV